MDNDCNGATDEGFDADGDGVASCFDNCLATPNPDQADGDADHCGNACDQAPVDPLVQTHAVGDTLGVTRAGTTAVLDWSAEALAGPFNVYRGRVRPEGAFAYDHYCATLGVAATTATDGYNPLPGDAFYYLITRVGACGESRPGVDSAGAAIPLSDACPSTGTDVDTDGVEEVLDNCPGLNNPSQDDADADYRGDVCDNCPAASNPDQSNLDTDTLGDACDPDMDGDGVPNVDDNCPRAANPGQQDGDGDGTGDACDPTPLPLP